MTANDAVVPQGVEQSDLNQDGYTDIVVNLFSNTPGDEEQFVFDPRTQRFKRLRNALDYSNSTHLKGTGLCWSYNRAGCADYSWESWLYGIEGDSAFSMGHMLADICPGQPGPMIRVFRSTGNMDVVILDTLTADTSMEFLSDKWRLIEDYWRVNWRRFAPAPM